MSEKDDGHRIDSAGRTVTWEETATIRIGYSRCDGCNVETPTPPTSVLVEFAQHGGGGRVLWPFDNSFSSHWQWIPAGWTRGEGTPGARHCPECTRVIQAAVAEVLRGRMPTP